MLENFWKRWESEYLTSLLQRKKWLNEKEHFKIGQLVLIADENLPPARKTGQNHRANTKQRWFI